MRSTPLLALLALHLRRLRHHASRTQRNPHATAAAPSRYALPATDDGIPGTGPIRRYPWFQKLWLERRTAWAGQDPAPSERRRLSSATPSRSGWKDFPRPVLPRRKGRQPRHQRRHHPAASCSASTKTSSRSAPLPSSSSIGTNDLEENAAPWSTATNLRLLLAALKRRDPAMPVVVCAVMPSSPTKKRPAHLIRRIKQLHPRGHPRPAAGHGARHLETLRRRAKRRPARRVPRSPPPQRRRLHQVRRRPPPHPRHPRLHRARARYLHAEPGFVSLFNGRDLTGWGARPTTETELAIARRMQAADIAAPRLARRHRRRLLRRPQRHSPDARWRAQSGGLKSPPPRPAAVASSSSGPRRESPKNFVLELESRASPNADGGVYIRGPQLQARDYLIAGPYLKLEKFRPYAWNELGHHRHRRRRALHVQRRGPRSTP